MQQGGVVVELVPVGLWWHSVGPTDYSWLNAGWWWWCGASYGPLQAGEAVGCPCQGWLQGREEGVSYVSPLLMVVCQVGCGSLLWVWCVGRVCRAMECSPNELLVDWSWVVGCLST